MLKHAITAVVVLLLIGLMLMMSSRYLVYADQPRCSDIIVLFSGADARLQEARQLLREGYAGHLFVPVTFTLFQARSGSGMVTAVRSGAIKTGVDLPGPRPEQEQTRAYFQKTRTACGVPGFYEDTHAEMIMAKIAMDAYGYKSAIFVSSPYHMKRIKIMAARVFDPSYGILLVPTRFEKKNNGFALSWLELERVVTEGVKILWFLCYAG